MFLVREQYTYQKKMKLLGLDKLEAFKHRHADVRSRCESWEQEVLSADWKVPQDIKNDYSSASFLSNNRVIFNLKGIKYRVGVLINYPTGTVLVEWALNHTEYNKKFK